MQRFLRLSIATLVLGLCGSACGDDDDSDSSKDGGGNDASTEKDGGGKDSGGSSSNDSIEVAGDWDNQFGMEEIISDTMWGPYKMIEFDNDTNIAITQNAKDDMFNPGKFNKTLWIEPTADGFAYCQFAFGKESAADAKDADPNEKKDTANEDDLEMGCGGFAWTMLTPHKEGGGEDAGSDSDAGN